MPVIVLNPNIKLEYFNRHWSADWLATAEEVVKKKVSNLWASLSSVHPLIPFQTIISLRSMPKIPNWHVIFQRHLR
jgi:hypothetical protein